MTTGLKVVWTDRDRDRRGNFIIGNVVEAIAKTELPDDELAIQKELQKREDQIAAAIATGSQDQPKQVALAITGRKLVAVDDQLFKSDDGKNNKTVRSYSYSATLSNNRSGECQLQSSFSRAWLIGLFESN